MKKFITFHLNKRSIIIFLFSLSVLIPLYTILAETMQSGTYKIMSDTVNVSGQDSSSPNYGLKDTAGEVGTGNSNSDNYYMHAGFWQMQESYIAITPSADLALTSIGGINGEATEGTMSWQVITDNYAGYTMNIKTTTVPALKSSLDSFADYAPSGANPDFNFSIPSTTSAFGFSPEGVDTDARFRDDGSACNTGGIGELQDKCWDGLSISPKTIFQRSTSNHQEGTTETVRFRAESGADKEVRHGPI